MCIQEFAVIVNLNKSDNCNPMPALPANRVTMILNGQCGVSTDIALRLARCFGTTAHLWMNLQQARELRQAETAAGREIDETVTPRRSAG